MLDAAKKEYSKGEAIMPKNNPNRNQPNYKIGGSHINEYEFDQNKGEITEEEEHLPLNTGQENSGEITEHRTTSGAGGGPSSGKNG